MAKFDLTEIFGIDEEEKEEILTQGKIYDKTATQLTLLFYAQLLYEQKRLKALYAENQNMLSTIRTILKRK